MKLKYAEYLELKEQEEAIKEKRYAIEGEIYSQYQAQIEKKIKGSTSIEDDEFNVTVTRNLVRKWDQGALHRLHGQSPLPFKTEFKIGESDLKDLDSNLANDVLECSITQYNKPTFKIERL